MKLFDLAGEGEKGMTDATVSDEGDLFRKGRKVVLLLRVQLEQPRPDADEERRSDWREESRNAPRLT